MASLGQKAFSAGEIAPSLYARTDLTKYNIGLAKCRNFQVMRHGGVQNRAGTQYIGEVKTSSKFTRVIEFIFSQSVSYVLEFGDQYIRIIKNGAYVETTPASGVKYEIASPYLESQLEDIKFVQSADVMTLVHPSHAPRNLRRLADNSWTLTSISFDAGINIPTKAGVSTPIATGGTAGSTTYNYTITSFDPIKGIESVMPTNPPSGNQLWSIATGNATLSSTNYIELRWKITSTYATAPSMADMEYVIYREANGIYGYIGVAKVKTATDTEVVFRDIGYTADLTDTPPKISEDFNATDEYPSTCTYYQQRLVMGSSNKEPERVWASKTGNFFDFSSSTPIQADDAVLFRLAGRTINKVNHLVDLNSLIIFTESGEYSAQGDSSGTLTPEAINVRQSTYNGSSSKVRPIVIGNSCVYVQARGNTVRDLSYKYESNDYVGSELSIYASHLFENYKIKSWAYQQIPHSILWAVRDDGVLLGLTYIKEQQMLAWHQHDLTNGFVESCCVVPEDAEDMLYITVVRIINGQTKRYVERLSSRRFTDQRFLKVLDSHLSYDGTNYDNTKTMTLSGSGRTYTDLVTVTCNSATVIINGASRTTFTVADVGNEVHFKDSSGEFIKIRISNFISSTVVQGYPNKTIPLTYWNTALSNWAMAPDEFSGLSHLEGQYVSILGDGLVAANPLNPSYTMVQVVSGKVTLSERYSVVHIGLPIVSDFKTLPIDNPGADTMVDRSKLVNKVTLMLEKSSTFWAGTEEPSDDSLTGLTEAKTRTINNYSDTLNQYTEPVELAINSAWNKGGQVFVRHVDPLPLTILSVTPAGYFPFPINDK